MKFLRTEKQLDNYNFQNDVEENYINVKNKASLDFLKHRSALNTLS